MPQGKRVVDDAEIVEFMLESDEPAFTAGELAEEFGMTRQGMHGRLSGLHEEGRICRKKSGERTVVWWAAER